MANSSIVRIRLKPNSRTRRSCFAPLLTQLKTRILAGRRRVAIGVLSEVGIAAGYGSRQPWNIVYVGISVEEF